MDKLRELVTELMAQDEPAFITQRVDNFFEALDEAGYDIVKRQEPAMRRVSKLEYNR